MEEKEELTASAPEEEPIAEASLSSGEVTEAAEAPMPEEKNVASESPEGQPETLKGAAPEPVQPAGPAAEEEFSLDYSQTFRTLSEGDVVPGTVVHIDREGVLVDIGQKSEGIIPPGELSRDAVISAEEVVQVGERISVYVLATEDKDGNLILSKKRADFEKAWERVIEAYKEGKILNAMVTDRVKGGLVVDLGIRGFVPASHVGSGRVRNLEKYVGQSLPLKVIEVDRERRKVVLSHRQAVEEEKAAIRATTLASLQEGQVREGVVRRITEYGAFVDLGGIDGLLHVSEMSWTRINHPKEILKEGDRINVMILKVNLETNRISLGLRQILPDPWNEIESRYHVGDIIHGSVSRLVPFGAFVQLEDGIEGIIPNGELSQRRVSKPEDVVQVGDEVEVKVIDLRPDERRLTLSLKQAEQQKERREYEEYTQSRQRERGPGRVTLGDLVGDQLDRSIGKKDEEAEDRDEKA